MFLPLSFVCSIVSAVLVWQGGKRTKKTKEVVDRLEEAYAYAEEKKEVQQLEEIQEEKAPHQNEAWVERTSRKYSSKDPIHIYKCHKDALEPLFFYFILYEYLG